jgi:ADP-heptose:LPS heptosyltransferase
MRERRALLHLAAGVGNIVLATPLLIALHELGLRVDLLLDADYPETAELLRPWSILDGVYGPSELAPLQPYDIALPAVPPFYWPRLRRRYPAARLAPRPADALFYENEQRYYLSFAYALGYPERDAPACSLPVGARPDGDVSLTTVVLAPGCKTGEMAAKRWPYFPALAERFEDVVVVGTSDDERVGETLLRWPSHVRSFTGRLTLRETAELMAGAGVVVANDSGLAHIAAAVGTSTVMLFGPTPHETLGALAANVTVLRRGGPCEPCWFGARFAHCAARIDCLRDLGVDRVATTVHLLLRGAT